MNSKGTGVVGGKF